MVNPDAKIDWQKETLPVGRTTMTSMVLVVPKDAPYQDLAGLIAAAKAEPGSISYGTPGNATAQHLVGELLNAGAGIELLHVPYRGGAQIMTDLIGGTLNSAVAVLSTALPYIQQDQVRALAIFDSSRSPLLPNVPALSESPGFAGVSMPLWQGDLRQGRHAGSVRRSARCRYQGGPREPAGPREAQQGRIHRSTTQHLCIRRFHPQPGPDLRASLQGGQHRREVADAASGTMIRRRPSRNPPSVRASLAGRHGSACCPCSVVMRRSRQ